MVTDLYTHSEGLQLGEVGPPSPGIYSIGGVKLNPNTTQGCIPEDNSDDIDCVFRSVWLGSLRRVWAPPDTARNSLWLWGLTLGCVQTSLASIPGFAERSLCIGHQLRTTGHCRSWQPLGVPPRVFSEGSCVGCKCGLFLFSIFANTPLGTCGFLSQFGFHGCSHRCYTVWL